MSETLTTHPRGSVPVLVPRREERAVSGAAASGLVAQRAIEDDAQIRAPESVEGLPLIAAHDATAPRNDASERPVQWCFIAGAWAHARPITWRVFTTAKEQTAEGYLVASDSGVVWSGSQSVALRTSASGQNSAVVWQAVDATPYRGSRVEVSAHLRKTFHAGRLFIGTHDAATPFRASGNDAWLDEQPPATWTSVTVALDVPPWAVVLYYGAGIHNGGSLWLDDVRVERTPPSTQAPAAAVQPRGVLSFFLAGVPEFLAAPSNLDFEVTTSDVDNRAGCGIRAE